MQDSQTTWLSMGKARDRAISLGLPGFSMNWFRTIVIRNLSPPLLLRTPGVRGRFYVREDAIPLFVSHFLKGGSNGNSR